VLHGSGQALRDTAVYQPVTIALCAGVHEEVTACGPTPAVVAGHSLGELAACVAAGVLSSEAAVDVAALRGRLMTRAAEGHPGGMVAVRVASRDAALEAARLVASRGLLQIAAHNAPDEVVLSGPWAALRALPNSCHTIPLSTGGPWHSAALAEEVDEYREALRRACRGLSGVTLVCNATGAPVRKEDDIADLIARQLTRPVEWVATLGTLESMHVTTVVTVGPAKALRRLARRALGATARVLGVDVPEDLLALATVEVP
jgi:[acyl-carrier-protein] S-malonyltransferase